MPKVRPLTEEQIAQRLDTERLERGWSFRELGQEIGSVLDRDPIPEPTVRKFIRRAGSFHETTVYPLRKYVEHLIDQDVDRAAGITPRTTGAAR